MTGQAGNGSEAPKKATLGQMTLTYEQKRQRQAIESLSQRLWLLERDYEKTRIRANRVLRTRCERSRELDQADMLRMRAKREREALGRSDALLDARASALREAPAGSDRV